MKRYDTYLLFLVLGFFLPALVWLALVQFQLGAPTESSRWPFELYQRKLPLAEAMPSPKVIIASGSSGLFSLSARQIEEKTSVKTVNLGTWAGLGLDYLLTQVKSVTRPGDIVLLTLEYAYYAENGAPNDAFLDYLVARDVDYFGSLSYQEQLRYAFAMSPGRLLEGLRAKLHPPAPRPRSDGYEANTVDNYGDETINRESNKDAALIARLASQPPLFVLKEGILEESVAWEQLAEFIRWCEREGVVLLASYPATLFFDDYEQLQALEAAEEIAAFFAGYDVPVLGSVFEFMYDSDLFYDTAYHLTDHGRRLHTDTIVELMYPYLAAAVPELKLAKRERDTPTPSAQSMSGFATSGR